MEVASRPGRCSITVVNATSYSVGSTMPPRTAQERLEIGRQTSPIAAGLFVFCGIVLQVAILWSGYWDAAPARTAIPVRPVTPVAVPNRAMTLPAAQGLGPGDARSFRPTGPAAIDAPADAPRANPEARPDGQIERLPARPAGRGPTDPAPGDRPATPSGNFGRA